MSVGETWAVSLLYAALGAAGTGLLALAGRPAPRAPGGGRPLRGDRVPAGIHALALLVVLPLTALEGGPWDGGAGSALPLAAAAAASLLLVGRAGG